MPAPPLSVVIPTRDRPGYLDVTLASMMGQARAAGAEVIVVIDGPDASSEAVARRHGAEVVTLPGRRGANAARNAGIAVAGAALIALLDDDVRVADGWLESLLAGAAARPDLEVLGGPIRAELEGFRLPVCGREPPPITRLWLGGEDREAEFVWSANMAIRRSALDRIGPFDERLGGRGEEEEWERRYKAAGGRIGYVAAAGVAHRRAAEDARLPALARAAYRLGRSARRYDVAKGAAPPAARELRVLLGCAWHTVRRRCAFGIVMGAHALGRLRELAGLR